MIIRKKIKKRIIVDAILMVLVFIFPWWVTFVIAAVLSFIFETFIEAAAVGLILDSLYGVPGNGLFGFQYTLTAVMGLLLLISRFLKSRMVFYPVRSRIPPPQFHRTNKIVKPPIPLIHSNMSTIRSVKLGRGLDHVRNPASNGVYHPF